MIGFIVNGVSGNGKGRKVWHDIEHLLKERKVEYKVKFTERPEHAIEIAKEMAKQNDIKAVVAVGGDGTVHEVANGLVGSEIPLGYIPAGSGNDFARGLEIPSNNRKALERVLCHEKQKIDIAFLNNRVFVNGAGIGFDGQVAKVTNEAAYKKWLNFFRLGKLSYVISVFKVLYRYHPTNVTIFVDDREIAFSDVWLIAVANIPFYGGGMMICPGARHNDGIFNVCIVHGISRWELLKLFPRVFRGTHIFHRSVATFAGKRLKIISTSPLTIHGDGEYLGETPVQITIKKHGLNVL